MTAVDRGADAGEASVPEPIGGQNALPHLVFRPLLLIVGIAGTLLGARSGRYPWFGDELYFQSAGRRLSFGYVDQGPLVPLLARVFARIAPDSLVAQRLPVVCCAVATIWVCALTAREFGGGWSAQVTAALAYAATPFLVTSAASLCTFAFDALLSALLLWIMVRWTRIRQHRWLLAAALVAAVDLQVKLLLPVLGCGILLGAAIVGPRQLFRTPMAWAAAVLVAAAAAPGLWWQSRHGWPQVAMGPVIAAEQGAATGGATGLPVQEILLLGLPGTVLAIVGLWALLNCSSWRAYRFVVVAVLVQSAFVLFTVSRPYYLAGLFPVLIAAGAVRMVGRERPRWAEATGGALLAASVTFSGALVFVLPMAHSALREPVHDRADLSARIRLYGMDGGPELIAAVRSAAATLGLGERGRAVVITQNYWQAALLDQPSAELPPVYSPDRGFGYLGVPPESATTVLYVGAASAEPMLWRTFRTVEPLARLDDPLGFPGLTRNAVIWRCDDPRRPWARTWPGLRTLDLDPGLEDPR